VDMILCPVTGWLQKCALESQASHKRICLWNLFRIQKKRNKLSLTAGILGNVS